MDVWEKNIFVTALKARMRKEGTTAEEILLEYLKLSAEKRDEILSAIAE